MRVGGRLALFYIHQMNRVNSRNDVVVMTALQHYKYRPGYYYYYYYYLLFPLSRNGKKNSAKKFLDPSMIRICTEMELFVASEISHHYKKLQLAINFRSYRPNSYKKLKLSLADKPPDALCKRNGVADLLKTHSSPGLKVA